MNNTKQIISIQCLQNHSKQWASTRQVLGHQQCLSLDFNDSSRSSLSAIFHTLTIFVYFYSFLRLLCSPCTPDMPIGRLPMSTSSSRAWSTSGHSSTFTLRSVSNGRIELLTLEEAKRTCRAGEWLPYLPDRPDHENRALNLLRLYFESLLEDLDLEIPDGSVPMWLIDDDANPFQRRNRSHILNYTRPILKSLRKENTTKKMRKLGVAICFRDGKLVVTSCSEYDLFYLKRLNYLWLNAAVFFSFGARSKCV